MHVTGLVYVGVLRCCSALRWVVRTGWIAACVREVISRT